MADFRHNCVALFSWCYLLKMVAVGHLDTVHFNSYVRAPLCLLIVILYGCMLILIGCTSVLHCSCCVQASRAVGLTLTLTSVCRCVLAGGMGVNASTASNGAMGAYGQNSLAGGATGGAMSLGSASNGLGAASQTSQQGNAMDTINQAYSGIQQYAGLSGLLNQGKCNIFYYS